MSVAGMLGGACPTQVRTGALIAGDAPEQCARAARQAVQAGFRTLKLKVAARPLAADEARLDAVRDAVGGEVQLRVDANGGWTEEQALEALSRLGRFGLELCEQPVRAADVAALRRLRGAVPCAVAADEALLLPGAAQELLAGGRPAVDAVVLKPVALGGLLPCLEVARQARSVNVAAFVTTLLDGPVGRAAATHLAAAIEGPGNTLAHGLATGGLFAEGCSGGLGVKEGAVTIPEIPGWGFP
ncbi:MAG: enolase C-terminal domain-like protein [Myxococcales bacterium]